MPDVPLVSLDNIVLFPGQTLPLTVTRPAVIRALKELLEDASARRLLLVASPAALESERALRVGTTGGEAAPQMRLARPACLQAWRLLCTQKPEFRNARLHSLPLPPSSAPPFAPHCRSPPLPPPRRATCALRAQRSGASVTQDQHCISSCSDGNGWH